MDLGEERGDFPAKRVSSPQRELKSSLAKRGSHEAVQDFPPRISNRFNVV